VCRSKEGPWSSENLFCDFTDALALAQYQLRCAVADRHPFALESEASWRRWKLSCFHGYVPGKRCNKCSKAGQVRQF
jgi:hypothetical protein